MLHFLQHPTVIVNLRRLHPMRKGLFPGSFDPPSQGHLDIIKRASHICDKLYVAIAKNPAKHTSLFSVEEKKEMLQDLTKQMRNIEIVSFSGLIVEFAKKIEADFLIRGLRAFSDFEYEFRIALANRKLSGIETVFLMADERLTHLNSTLIREIAALGGSLKDFVPPGIEKKIKEKMKNL